MSRLLSSCSSAHDTVDFPEPGTPASAISMRCRGLEAWRWRSPSTRLTRSSIGAARLPEFRSLVIFVILIVQNERKEIGQFEYGKREPICLLRTDTRVLQTFF